MNRWVQIWRGLPLVAFAVFATGASDPFASPVAFRGVYFNPQVKPETAQFPWLLFYPDHRARIRSELEELVARTGVNLVDIFIPMPHTLKVPPHAPQESQSTGQWANTAYLEYVAQFVDDCHEAGLSVEIDLACNLWVPYSVDTEHHLANSGVWPKPDDSPWNEAATWYRGVIVYIEEHAKHPESIAMWSMMGNYQLGEAEPVLWDTDHNPAIKSNTEQFVKRVWPIFRSAGKRPKASPILLPILSSTPYWTSKTPEARLSAFTNLKRWLIDDLALPPDYWVMSSYGFCDPAPDGYHYLRAIVEILGKENASQIVSTDLKGPGHEYELQDCIMPAGEHSGTEILAWHFRKCREYGFAGWWIWAYQDTPEYKSGIKTLRGGWKDELKTLVKQQSIDNQ